LNRTQWRRAEEGREDNQQPASWPSASGQHLLLIGAEKGARMELNRNEDTNHLGDQPGNPMPERGGQLASLKHCIQGFQNEKANQVSE
jgi:hypothetical protein